MSHAIINMNLIKCFSFKQNCVPCDLELEDSETNFSSHLAAQVVYENTFLCFSVFPERNMIKDVQQL